MTVSPRAGMREFVPPAVVPAAPMRVAHMLVALVLAIAGAVPAFATAREFAIEVAAGTQADRNGRLREGEDEVRAGMRLGVGIEMLASHASGIVVLPMPGVTTVPGASQEVEVPSESLRIDAMRLQYHDAPDLDEDRYAVSYRRAVQGEATGGALQLAAVDRDARTSEAGFGDGEAVRDDDQRRRELSAQLDGFHYLDEDTLVGADVAVLRTRFHDGTVRSLADFDVLALTARLQRDLRLDARIAFALSADRFTSEFGGNRRVEDTLGLRVDYVLALSASTLLRLGAGVRRTDIDARFRQGGLRAQARDRQAGLLGELALEHAWSGGDVALSLARTRQPSGVGAQFERDEASIVARVPLDDTRTATLLATFDRNRADGDGARIPDERLWSLRAGMAWQLDEALALDLQLGYRAQAIDGSARTRADGAVAQVGIRYQLDPITP